MICSKEKCPWCWQLEVCELYLAIKLERKKCQSTLKHDSTPLKLPEPKCAYHALPDMAFLASRHHIFNNRIPINFAPIWLYSPVCKAPHVSGNMFSQEGARHHQEHEVNLILHPFPLTWKKWCCKWNILLLSTTSLCLLGLQVEGLKEDFLRGSLEQHSLHWNFYLPFACSDWFKIHLNMQILLKILELCSFIYRKFLISNTFSYSPYVYKCLLSCNITVLLQIKTEMAVLIYSQSLQETQLPIHDLWSRRINFYSDLKDCIW